MTRNRGKATLFACCFRPSTEGACCRRPRSCGVWSTPSRLPALGSYLSSFPPSLFYQSPPGTAHGPPTLSKLPMAGPLSSLPVCHWPFRGALQGSCPLWDSWCLTKQIVSPGRLFACHSLHGKLFAAWPTANGIDFRIFCLFLCSFFLSLRRPSPPLVLSSHWSAKTCPLGARSCFSVSDKSPDFFICFLFLLPPIPHNLPSFFFTTPLLILHPTHSFHNTHHERQAR